MNRFTLLDTENLEYIEVVRRGSISHANDMRARGDFGQSNRRSDGAFVNVPYMGGLNLWKN